MPYKDPEKRRQNAAERSRRRYAADPEKARARAAKWVQANRPAARAATARWRAANLEACRAADLARRNANLDEAREKNREWLKAHPEKAKAWRAANRDAERAMQQRRRAHGFVTTEDLLDVRDMADGVCAYCLQSCARLTLDHVAPVSRKGTNDLDNLVMACQSCNSSKGAKTPLEFLCGLPKLGVR